MKQRIDDWLAGVRGFALWLDDDPGTDSRRRAVHHGARMVLLVAVALTTYLLFPVAYLSEFAGLERGMVPQQDIIAEFDFQVLKTDDQLAQERAEAAASVPPIFDYVPAAEDTVAVRLQRFIEAVDSVAEAAAAARVEAEADPEREPVPVSAAIEAYMEARQMPPPPGGAGLLASWADRDRFHTATELAVRQLYPQGVVERATLPAGMSPIHVRWGPEEEEYLMADSVLSRDTFLQLAAQRLPDDFGPAATELQRHVLLRYFAPSLELNEAETAAARERHRMAVNPVLTTVRQGERVVAAREQIGEREELRLRAYERAMAERGLGVDGRENVLPAFGGFLFNLIVLSIIGLLLWFFRREVYHDVRSTTLIAVLLVATLVIASLIARFELPVELIPVTFTALILAALFGARFALVVALVSALLIGGQQPFLGLTVPFTAAVGGAAAAFAIKAVERRSKIWFFVAIISAAYIVAVLALGLLRSREISDILTSMLWGVTNGVVSSLLAIGFLPLLESVTRITTDQTLLELSDLNRPLLKRLSLEASGTYAHTINVSNLAEASSNAIGANGLLARVGVYYHDIGKLVKPQYFVENQPKGRNPHDKLKPSMSAAIIRSHVVEGLKLAEEAKLPEVIRNFIAEHHGTQQIAFFYDKAKEQDPDGEINPTTFAYPGPKPQSKETAIVMLADSVESAARVLNDPTPSRLRELVEKIVAGKIASGQLDQCPLTLREIDIVKEYLAKVLNGMYHHRVEYGARETTAQPQAPTAPAGARSGAP